MQADRGRVENSTSRLLAKYCVECKQSVCLIIGYIFCSPVDFKVVI